VFAAAVTVLEDDTPLATIVAIYLFPLLLSTLLRLAPNFNITRPLVKIICIIAAIILFITILITNRFLNGS